MQHGWLDCDEDIWILNTDIPNDVERKWTDEAQALTELTEEGWTVIDPYPFEPEIFYGYVLNRTEH
jgi:hypothetical protein